MEGTGSAEGSADGSADTTTRVPLRPLGVAELLDGAARLVRRNARASFAIALPVEVVGTLAVTVLAYSSLDSVRDTDTASAVTGRGQLDFGQLLLELVVASLVGIVLSGLLSPLFVEDVLGGRMTAGQALRRVGRSALPLLALAVMAAIGLTAGLVLLVVGGVWLWGVWALAAPALVTERLGPFRALGRSLALVRTGYWRVWGTRALAWLVVTVLNFFITIPFGALAVWLGTNGFDFHEDRFVLASPGLYLTITALGSVVAGVLFGPFRSAVDALLYLDARMRREGLDITVALDAAVPAPAPRPAPSW